MTDQTVSAYSLLQFYENYDLVMNPRPSRVPLPYTAGTILCPNGNHPMAGSSLLALLDDIATLLDDISVMTKVAAKKTAGVLGDDLAVNAGRVTGVRAVRELPVV